MTEDFVTYDLAVKLKEKGFKEKCVAYYYEKINEHTPSFVLEDKMPEDWLCLLDLLSNHNRAEWSPFIDAPTISQVLKWLRKEKYIAINIEYTPRVFQYKIINMSFDERFNPYGRTFYTTYEDAALDGIKYVVDNLI